MNPVSKNGDKWFVKNWIVVKAFDLKWATNWIILSDDTHDGTASFAYNRFTKNDEWSRNQKRNGTNASKYECSKPGN